MAGIGTLSLIFSDRWATSPVQHAQNYQPLFTSCECRGTTTNAVAIETLFKISTSNSSFLSRFKNLMWIIRGHGVGFYHSSAGDNEYGDMTCYMGGAGQRRVKKSFVSKKSLAQFKRKTWKLTNLFPGNILVISEWPQALGLRLVHGQSQNYWTGRRTECLRSPR